MTKPLIHNTWISGFLLLVSIKWGFVKVTTGFSYNRRCHSFSYSPPSQLAVGNCMYSEWHLDIGKLCFIFTKILCILSKQQAIDIDSCFVEGIRNKEFWHPRRVSHNTVDAVGIEREFCHNLINEVRQRFAAYYPDRKTQRERSTTTGSAGVMVMLLCMFS